MNVQKNKGDMASPFQIEDMNGVAQTHAGDGNHPILLSFFRHAGCPMCNLRVHELIQERETLDNYGVKILAIFESPAKSIRRDVGKQKPPFPIIPDPDRRLYKLYGVAPSWSGFVRIFLSRPKRVFEAIFKKGFIPKFAEATPMMPAEFLIAPDGKIKLAYYGTDIGDHLPLSDLYSALDEIAHENNAEWPSRGAA